MKYLNHIVKSGERIDIISKKYYGRVDNVEPIFRQNPQLKFSAFLEDHVGKTLIIPVEDSATATEYKITKPGIKAVE